MCKVSVIVPVYDVEKYLRTCLESLAAQTMDDIELIVVNDGSPDGSLAIAEEFAARDGRFRVFSTENRGAGSRIWAKGRLVRWGQALFCRPTLCLKV